MFSVKGRAAGVFCAVVLLAAVGAVMAEPPGEVWVGPGYEYATIQAGIDAVAEGGIVRVAAGTYRENINIENRLTLMSEVGPASTVINGEFLGTVVTIMADGVVVKGFTVSNSSPAGAAGIAVVSAEGCLISGNIVHGNDYGIALVGGASNNLVQDNEVFLNERGVFIDYFGSPITEESGNTVRENVIRDNFGQGVYLGETARENLIGPGNEISGNLRGIQLFASDWNEISRNEISGNLERGIALIGSHDNEISGNDITGGSQEDGIVLSTIATGVHAGTHSENNVFRDNRITGHPGYGVHATGDTANYADAAYNWWGAAGGPSHASNPGGSGDAVSDNVDFIPWYIDEEMTAVSGEAAEVWVGPGQPFASIQAAVNVVAPGGTVYVKADTYNENIVIDRELTLESEDGPGVTQIDGGGVDTVVTIMADGVAVKGFTVSNSVAGAAGIAVVSAEGCLIIGNVVTSNFIGIALVGGASNNLVQDNEVFLNERGVFIDYFGSPITEESGNTVRENVIRDNFGQGVYLGETARENLIRHNEISGNLRGILLYASDWNEISGNEISGNLERGIDIVGSHDNEISGNDITGGSQEHGIVLSTGAGGAADGIHSENNVFRDNRITGHPGYGVHATGDTANYADAAYNWWGDAGGPSHASNPGGSGDAVSDNVDFIPWYVDEEMTVHSAQPEEILVGPGQSFVSIQTAVNVVAPGGTVYVKAGTYNENIVIDRELTLESEDGPGVTLIDGGGADTVVMVTADGVAVKGFTVSNSAAAGAAGIAVVSAEGCLISGNIVHGNDYGIALVENANHNVVDFNEVHSNNIGVYINYLHDNTSSSAGNTVSNNNIYDNVGQGVYLGETARENFIGPDNEISGNLRGILLYASDWNEVSGNEIYGNLERGMDIVGSHDNEISGNYITGGSQEDGIVLSTGAGGAADGIHSENNVFRGNRITGHPGYGVHATGHTANYADAAYNWWGDAGGPSHASNPGGSGDAVSDNVDFIPWYVDEEMTAVSTHPDIEIATLAASDVEETSAVLRGELTALEDVDEVDVFFYLGESGGEMEATESETVSETGGFQKMVQELEPETEYQFRAQF